MFSVYFFAREKFSLRDAILEIFKIPGISAACFALFINYQEIEINKHIYTALEMGAYTSMVLQLLIFGMYLFSVKIKSMPWHLSLNISFVKHIMLPLLGIIIVLNFTNLNSYVASIIVMELMVPLAVNNVNLAALYHCKPFDVAATILVSSTVFVLLLYFYIQSIEIFIK